MKKNSEFLSWFVGALLIVIAVLIIIALAVVKSQTETTSVSVSQQAPTLASVKLCDTGLATSCPQISDYLGNANAPKAMDVLVKVTDPNGYGDISKVETTLYRSGIGGPAACAGSNNVDGNYCYNNVYNQTLGGVDACVFDSAEGITSAWWRCRVTLQSWMDATDPLSKYSSQTWNIDAVIYDTATSTSLITGSTFENTSVLSMNFGSSTISYGQMSLGATQAGVAVLGTLYGNSDADMTIQSNSAVMSCNGPGSANIPVLNQRFGTDNNTYELLASALSTSAQDLDFENNPNDNKLIARTSETTNPADSVYFGIQIPSTGVSGTCSVTATILTVAQ
ncbi:hypothetical protein COY25_01685 [Candidatus Uhrbacteria bacterium CG_4_10_14_0_2_um_filter_41_7]|uniref:Uncharacterized protein n=1 Tax=Candidatus Uhrbacteria bacterium CG_4_9_14_3_um_filter_41_35 TaxID=1975034 RepID=A0A2M7XGJ7_9BACT|nr:MAG: hypothetical protein COV92_02265 [Candidatus Uhrbacteria bacterium CG11_big_fil_rev_8_21_14_0_20_41_9]PIZ54860.1 MAG: hypothetical protein COY25_01685 [Candidatus Uhrbacteria bacterium CG_4_10_14_0_2_um_filter_41_7]PJA46856.1 MAG: hypothetical protein CO173_01380 [Candidatus Uhrbacteria bacterium CG_4_9_14_3_um_filter_41_35]